MRGIPVLLNDNQLDFVSGLELNILLEEGEVKAFRRSTGWVVIGHDAVRGGGSSYDGPERRRMRKRLCERGVVRFPDYNEKKERACLMCINMKGGNCTTTQLPNHQVNYQSM